MASRADLLESLFFVVVGLVLAGGVSLITYLVMSRASGEPRCGQCGYLSRGAASFTCPECGSDLRHVGIVRRDSRRAFVIATCAGLAVAGATIVVGGWLSL